MSIPNKITRKKNEKKEEREARKVRCEYSIFLINVAEPITVPLSKSCCQQFLKLN
jgi:hypothetical protein